MKMGKYRYKSDSFVAKIVPIIDRVSIKRCQLAISSFVYFVVILTLLQRGENSKKNHIV